MEIRPIRSSAERVVYRIAGLPVALWAVLNTFSGQDSDALQSAFAWQYWHPDGLSDWFELVLGLSVWPLAVLLGAAWYAWRNGSIIRRRHGRGILAQFANQLQLYFTAGIVGPWYYIFSLHEDGERRAKTFIQRFETKRCLFPLLKPNKGSPLTDKSRFSCHCQERQLRCVETIMLLEGSNPDFPLPDRDLFVKPTDGRGGRGAERWDRHGCGTFISPNGEALSSRDLLARLVSRSNQRALIVQPRLRPHSDLKNLTAGALPTIRVLTCLNEENEPEVMAAMLRTSFGESRTVDNLHAGGIGALVDIETGALSKASNLGSDASLGWFSDHPDTHARIEGHIVPCWPNAQALAVRAHRHFRDRVVVGWDIAVLQDGPILIEGNGNPDLDILQRFMRTGLRDHRFASLLSHHLRERVPYTPRT